MRRAAGSLRRRVSAQWRLKLRLSVALTLLFSVPYFTLQRIVLFPVRHVPAGRLDQAVPFVPEWVWVYQTVYLLVAVAPWLADSEHGLRRYARGFVMLAAVGFACFLFLPIEGPRPADVPADPMFRLLVSYDAPLNCFPSLHVALAAFSVLFTARLSRDGVPARSRRRLLTALWIWVSAIAFATLATKQHYAADLPAGLLLAWLSDRWAWRRVPLLVTRTPVPEAAR